MLIIVELFSKIVIKNGLRFLKRNKNRQGEKRGITPQLMGNFSSWYQFFRNWVIQWADTSDTAYPMVVVIM